MKPGRTKEAFMLRKIQNFASISNIVCCMLLVSLGCQKKCQPRPEEPFKSLTDVKWRLVETTDPQVAKGLDNFNFLVWTFNVNFSGEVHKVEGNEMYKTPVGTFTWNPIDVDVVEITYSTITPPKASIRGVTRTTITYHYRLGYELEMTNMTYGYYYRYVDYRGVVAPDNACEF